jgi:hypothetical protein
MRLTGARNFSAFARNHFAVVLNNRLTDKKIRLTRGMYWTFPLVCTSGKGIVGDAIWLERKSRTSGELPEISERIWLLQRPRAGCRLLVVGGDIDSLKKYVSHMQPLLPPVEVYFLNSDGHQQLC